MRIHKGEPRPSQHGQPKKWMDLSRDNPKQGSANSNCSRGSDSGGRGAREKEKSDIKVLGRKKWGYGLENRICLFPRVKCCAGTIYKSRLLVFATTLQVVYPSPYLRGCPGGSDSKESACNAGDPGSIPGSGRSPGERNNNPLQYSYLENSMDRGAWWAGVLGVTKSQTLLS